MSMVQMKMAVPATYLLIPKVGGTIENSSCLGCRQVRSGQVNRCAVAKRALLANFCNYIFDALLVFEKSGARLVHV